MEKIWNRLLRTIRYIYLRIVRIKAPSESIALGLALGVFSGCLPFLSLQMLIAVTLALLLRASKIAAALGTWWTNPFNWPFVFPLFYMLGRFFIPVEVVPLSVADLMHLGLAELFQRGWRWMLITTLGGVVAGIPLSVVTYVFTLRAVRIYHDARASRRRERRRKEIRGG